MQEVQLEKKMVKVTMGMRMKLRFLKIVIVSTKKKMKLRTWIRRLMEVTNRDIK